MVTLTLNSALDRSGDLVLGGVAGDAEDDLVLLGEQRRLLGDHRRQDGVVVTGGGLRSHYAASFSAEARLDRLDRVLGQHQGVGGAGRHRRSGRRSAARRCSGCCGRPGRSCRRLPAPAMTRALVQPELAEGARAGPAVLASFSVRLSTTISAPALALEDSAWRRARARTFLGRSKPWLRTTGPKARDAADELGRTARTVTGAAGALLLVHLLAGAESSLRVWTLWVPARRLASCQLTSAAGCRRGCRRCRRWRRTARSSRPSRRRA